MTGSTRSRSIGSTVRPQWATRDRLRAWPRVLAWYANRLRSMSVAEIGHRIRERCKHEVSARRASDWTDFDQGEGMLPALPRPPLDSKTAGTLRQTWEAAADAVARGEITLLGRHWPARTSNADWHLDPVTGRRWPHDIHCSRVPFRHDRQRGDVKYVWELNRLQHLQPVAALACVRGDGALREFCAAEVLSWMEANRPFDGLSWAAGIEVALRIVSLLTVFSFLDAEALAPETRRRLRSCLAAHGYWLARYPSRFSSANNHLIAEAAALFILGTVWPDLPGGQAYARHGRHTLIEELPRQILDDGVGAEQSPTYTAFVLEWYLLAAWVAGRAGKPFPADVRDRLALAGEHLRWVTDEGGHQPRIGDDDEGRVLAGGQRESDYVSSVLGCLAAWLSRPELAPPNTAPRLRNLYFGAPAADGEGPAGARTFGTGGYTVVRRDIAGRKVMLAMDHGPLGYLSIAAHGHADALAVWLHIDDMPVLVDAGTYLYHSGGPWRDAFRGTPAHNTLTLDFADSSTIAGPFNWSRKAAVHPLREKDRAGSCIAAGVHDGFEHGFGVRHERRIVVRDTGFSIRDRLSGELKRSAEVQISYLLHPALDASEHGSVVTVSRDGRQILTIGGDGLKASIHRGETAPPRGWFSPAFGEKMPTAQIVFRCAAATGRDFVTELSLPPGKTEERRSRAPR